MLLSYCTNVHPAEDLEGMLNQLRTYAGPIRAKAGLNSLGVGLWLPAVLAEELASSSSDRIALRELLTQQRLFIHTINAFPYGGFHNDIVKHDVYKPDWADPLRLEYTLNCAEVLADLLPDNVDGSISTLPLGWRDPWPEEKDIEATAAFVRLSEGLRDIKARTGRTIRVAVEPEPGCVLDDVADVVDWLAARIPAGIDPEHIGICLDACHLAVSFADPADSVRLITEAGLRVVKLQASAALHVQDPSQPTARDALDAFREPRYLHQVRELASDSVLQVDDLSEAIGTLPGAGPWRVHFHMPLHHVPPVPLATTTDVLRSTVEAVRRAPHGESAHLDVETYTWSVLPKGTESLVDGIAAELVWATNELLQPLPAV
jgi:sugar phosphate isomerase/epimerase